MPRKIFVNTRVLNFRMTGVQRYIGEILQRLVPKLEEIRPPRAIAGMRGHGWEQGILPYRVGGDVLWSPANTGPLALMRQVVTIHDVVPLDHPEWLNPRFAALHRWLIPRIARRAAHVITISEFTRRRILEHTGVPPEKVSVIYNGVDSRFTPQSEEDIDRMIRELDLPSRSYVLTLGSIEPRKNLPRLLEAWARLLPRIPDETWLVVSGLPGRSQVYDRVRIKQVPDRVRFIGYAPDHCLPALYSGARAFAYLSLYEGFGLPLLEAMACGAPVITGNATSLPEVVGDAGILADPEDVQEISAALERILVDNDLRQRLSARGLARSKNYSWQKASHATYGILSEVAAA
jgi:glycosyltransferase involved in cell wall biosynthesis